MALGRFAVISLVSLSAGAAAASAGIVSVSVDGIQGAVMTWNVPLLNPGDTWTRDFAFASANGDASAWGTIRATCNADARRATLNLTDFGMVSTNEAQFLGFELMATLDYGVIGGLAAALQKFQALQEVESANARIDWQKGSSWDGQILFPLSGFYDPTDLLNSSLGGSSGMFLNVSSPTTLVSRTFIQLRSGGEIDGVFLPESAFDRIVVPTPSGAAMGLAAGALGWRRRRAFTALRR